jgi:WD40 repeat protein
MRRNFPAGWRCDIDQDRVSRKQAVGSVRSISFPRELVCIVIFVMIAIAWIDTSELASPQFHMRRIPGPRGTLKRSLALSPDGRFMATSDSSGLVRIRDLASGSDIDHHPYEGRPRYIRALAFSPDSKYLAMGGTEPGILMLDLRTGSIAPAVGMPMGKINELAYSPDGRTLAASSVDDRSIVLCDPTSMSQRFVLHGDAPFLCIAFSPDGGTLAAGGSRGTISLWDVATGTERLRLHGESSPVFSVTFSPSGAMLASATVFDGKIRVWDQNSGGLVHVLEGHRFGTNAIAFLRDGTTLVSGGGDGMLRFWRVKTGQQTLRLDGQSTALLSLACSADGKSLAAIAIDSDVRLWELSDPTSSSPGIGDSLFSFPDSDSTLGTAQ